MNKGQLIVCWIIGLVVFFILIDGGIDNDSIFQTCLGFIIIIGGLFYYFKLSRLSK